MAFRLDRFDIDREHGCYRIGNTYYITDKTIETKGIRIVDAEDDASEVCFLQHSEDDDEDEAKGNGSLRKQKS